MSQNNLCYTKQLFLLFVYLFLLKAIHADDFFNNYEEVVTPHPENLEALLKCGEGDQKNKFKCVPYYNCDPFTNTIVDYPEVDGSSQIHPRIADPKCGHILEVCCQIANPTIHSVTHVPTMNLEFQSQCGVDTNAKLEFPWMVTLFNANSLNGRPFCGGSLLSAIVVLTAAHCIQNLKPEDIVIRAGQQRDFNSSKEENYQERNVAEIIIYEHFLKENFYNDLALLILNKSLIKSNNIETVCVPTNMDNINFNNCLVTTWGMQKNGNYSTVFKEKHISVFTNTDCQNILKTDLGDEIILHNSFFCTVENFRNNSICSGDGGSPLVCPDNFHRYFQVGIVSWSPYNCEDELKTKDSIVYTNLTQFSNWIDARLIELGYGAISS